MKRRSRRVKGAETESLWRRALDSAAKAVGGLSNFRLNDTVQDLDAVANGLVEKSRTNVTKFDDAFHAMLLTFSSKLYLKTTPRD